MWIPQKNEDCAWQKNRQQTSQRRPQKADNSVTLHFPKSARLLSKRQYQYVVKGGNKLICDYISIDYRRGKSIGPRLGITVSKRYGKAHMRNRFKRVVREAFRESLRDFPSNLDVNVLPKSPFQKISKQAILKDFARFLRIVTPSEQK